MVEKNDFDFDLDLEDNGEKIWKEDYRNYYYFYRFKMLFYENKVYVMYKCICSLRKFDNYCKYKDKLMYI